MNMSSFAKSLFGASSTNKENEMCSSKNNLSNFDDDCMLTQDAMETDSFNTHCTNANDDISRLRQNSSLIERPESFKMLRAEVAKERNSSSNSFVDNVKEWGRTASFDLGRSRPPSLDLGKLSREPSVEKFSDAHTPTYGRGNDDTRFRAPSMERKSSFDLARSILSTPSDFMFSKKRSQHPTHEGSSLFDTPWKRGGKQDKSKSSDTSSFLKTSRMQDDYHIIDIIGSGNFGSVYRAKRKLDDMVYAVKQSRHQATNSHERANLMREVQALAYLSNAESADNLSNIVRYYSSWIEDDFLYIQMEACEASVDLVYFDHTNITSLFRDMLNALKLVHKHDIVHLDIKPGNILFKNNQYKLCDFGMSLKTLDGKHSGDIDEGDSRYMARELLEWSCSSDLRKCDIFSLGITGYELICNKAVPASGPEWHDLRNGKFDFPEATISEVVQLISAMMGVTPPQRPTATECIEEFLFLKSPLQQEVEHLKTCISDLEIQMDPLYRR